MGSDISKPGWRGDDVSDEEFDAGFQKHFVPGLSDEYWIKDKWRVAFDAMEAGKGTGLLSALMRMEYPPPTWVCDRLSEMLNPETPATQGDRLKFERSPGRVAVLATEEQKVAGGVLYKLNRAKGKRQSDCRGAVEARFGYGEEWTKKALTFTNHQPDYVQLRVARKKGLIPYDDK